MSDLKEMPFLAHLAELRQRIIHTALGIAAASAFTLNWSSELFDLLRRPIVEHFQGVELIGTGPAEAFVTKLKVGIVAAVLVSLPFTFFQIWRFISPGLHENERKLAIPFIASSTIFFLCGASFCYAVVLPFAFQFFGEEFISIGLAPQIRISEYLSFALGLVVVFGVMFEMPLFAYLLARLGLITSAWLARQFRYAVVIIFIVAGILTPPDVVTQMLLAVPLLLLYGLSIVVARSGEKKHRPRQAPTL